MPQRNKFAVGLIFGPRGRQILGFGVGPSDNLGTVQTKIRRSYKLSPTTIVDVYYATRTDNGPVGPGSWGDELALLFDGDEAALNDYLKPAGPLTMADNVVERLCAASNKSVNFIAFVSIQDVKDTEIAEAQRDTLPPTQSLVKETTTPRSASTPCSAWTATSGSASDGATSVPRWFTWKACAIAAAAASVLMAAFFSY